MTSSLPSSLSRYPPNQPPSHRNPAYRNSQLIRSYVSLLQTTPLIVLFQHNNIRGNEWIGVRRELAKALQKADEKLLASNPEAKPLGDTIKLQVIQTRMFEPALRIAEYFRPSRTTEEQLQYTIESEVDDPHLTHALSRAAYHAAKSPENPVHPLTPLLSGPIALLTLPSVSPLHLRAALSVLSPQAPKFAAPPRRANPGYWDPPVQDGVKKLLLLGARVEGRVFDMEGARWVGTIEGGLDGLRAELVGILQGFGAGLAGTLEMASTGLGVSLASTLEGASRSLWFTVEGRRSILEDEQKPKEEVASEEAPSTPPT